MTNAAEKITYTPAETLKKLGLSINSEFIPFSQSRNAKEKHLSLNWRVTVLCNGRDVMTTDYQAGSAHCPSYVQGDNSRFAANRLKTECEKGFAITDKNSEFTVNKNKPILPKIEDVFYSLSMDSDVLDCSTYEEWAGNFGYDPDSRKGEALYRLCLQHTLALRVAIGESGLAKLSEAFADY